MIKVINVISDSNIGGAGRMLLTFLKNYDRNRINMTVLLPAGSMLIEEIDKLGVRVLTAEGLDTSLNISAVKGLRNLLKSEKPDVVHTHASMSARIAARFTGGIKIVYTRHSVFPNSPKKTKFPAKQMYGAFNNYFADAAIAVSPAAADLIIEAGQSPKKVKVIYNGVDELLKLNELEKSLVRSEYGLAENDFVCGIFARLTPVKGHEYVLKAAEMLKDKTDIKFVIAGTGEIEDQLLQDAQRMGLKNVVFTGFLSNVERLTGAIDLQLNASYGTEATSLALLEGMSIGIPAVVSSFGGNPYVIQDGENGIVFPERDAEAFTKAITELYTNKELYAKMSENSVRIFNEKFTSKEMTRNIEDLYYSL